MRPPVRFLAVYGSLLDGVPAPTPPAGVREELKKMDTIFLPGDLYVVRGENYPGFVPRVNGNKVEAQLYFVQNESVFEALDKWEGASGAPDAPYERTMMTVYHKGQSITFWVYIGKHDNELRCPIDATCWRDYFAANFATSINETA
jgi:gamma-glutamylcyclotransferase (GGCT)/AIG2-like uncharacterized protein YtfP